MKVSVIIPNYNRAKLVGETIENMLRQTLAPHEVIVVDDGSTDESVAVIRSFGTKVTLIEQSNQGPGASRNAGLKAATGDFVQFMDSDDLASLNKLEAQVCALNAAKADIAYGPWAKVWIENTEVRFEGHVLQAHPLPDRYTFLEWFLRGWSTVLQACLFRRSLLQKIDPMRTDLMVWEDGEYLVRLLVLQPEIVFTPNCLTFYRLHSGAKLTETGTSGQRRLKDRAVALDSIFSLLQAHPGSCRVHALHHFERLKESAEAEVRGERPTLPWRRRIQEFVRRKVRGDHWPYYYGSERPGPICMELLRELGFRTVGPNDE